MKKLLAGIVIPVVVLALISAVPGPPSTEFTRGFMRTSNQPEAQAYLGMVTGGSSTTIVVQTITVVTNNVQVMKGGHVTISNNITMVTNSTLTFSNMPWPSVMVVGANGDLTNASLSGLTLVGNTLTASGSGGGASVWVPNTALAYSGSNVTIDGSGGTNFFLNLTGTTFFATPANIPASKTTNTSFSVFFQQPSTGTCLVTWTNGSFKWPGGSLGAFQPDTNANAVSWVSFTMSPFTNGIFMGSYGVLGSQ